MTATQTLDTATAAPPSGSAATAGGSSAALVAFVAIFTAWVFWAGWDGDQANLEATDTAYTIADAHHVDITLHDQHARRAPR